MFACVSVSVRGNRRERGLVCISVCVCVFYACVCVSVTVFGVVCCGIWCVRVFVRAHVLVRIVERQVDVCAYCCVRLCTSLTRDST